MYIAYIKHISNIKHRIMYILLEKDTNARKIYPFKEKFYLFRLFIYQTVQIHFYVSIIFVKYKR